MLKNPKNIAIILIILVIAYLIYLFKFKKKVIKNEVKNNNLLNPDLTGNSNSNNNNNWSGYPEGTIPFVPAPDLLDFGNPFLGILPRESTAARESVNTVIQPEIYNDGNVDNMYSFNSYDGTTPRSQSVGLNQVKQTIFVDTFNSGGGVIKSF